MSKLLIRHAVAGVVLLIASRGFGATVNWVCPQARVTSVPASSALAVEFDPQTAEVHSPALDDLFSKIQADSTYDYSSCLSNLVTTILFARNDVCRASAAGRPAFCDSPEGGQAAWRALEKRVTIYAAHAARAGAVPAFEPGAYNQPPIAPARLTTMTQTAKYLCGLNNEEDPQVFDAAFLDGVLPSLLVGPDSVRFKTACAQTTHTNRVFTALIRQAAKLELSRATCEANREKCLLQHRKIGAVELKVLAIARDAGFPVVAESTRRKLEGSPGDLDSLNRALFDVSLESSQTMSCMDLAPGDAKSLYADPGTGLSAMFKLTRLPDEPLAEPYRKLDGSVVSAGARVASYESTINLLFTDHTGKVNTPEKLKKWNDWVQGCFDFARPFLRGPGGELFRIRAISSPDGQNGDQPHRISIAQSARGDTGSWMLSFSCKEVLHETLHLHGLVDEYHEGWQFLEESPSGDLVATTTAGPGRYIQDDCRILGPDDSIMSSMKAWDEASLPYKTWDYEGYKITAKPTRSSLLSPGQFRTITRPGCLDENRVFYACSRESAKTSRENYGRERCSAGLPTECFLPKGAWVNVKAER